MSDQVSAEANSETRKPGRPKKAEVETVNIKIKSMGGKFATTGVNIVAGKLGKLKHTDVCEVSVELSKSLQQATDLIEETRLDANCKLVGEEIFRD